MDFFDTMTTSCGPDTPATPAHRVLRLMISEGPPRFDRRIVKLLADVVGTYPIGSVVELASGRKGRVIARNMGGDAPWRPVIELAGASGDEGTLDLAEVDRATGQFVHEVASATPPAESFESAAAFVAFLGAG